MSRVQKRATMTLMEERIEQREEECHTRLILIESECGLALLFLCPRQQRSVLCEDNRLLCYNSSLLYFLCFFFCKIKLSYGTSLVSIFDTTLL